MNKDVIYIDIEDDITAIIGKVKDAEHNIVALVPPKRVGVLQSAVNLKLLQKAADSAGKRVVLISSDHSLLALAAGLKLPVARNLQSRPEIPDMPEPESPQEEIINGADLPVGELAASMGQNPDGTKADQTTANPASPAAANPTPKPLPDSLAKSPLIQKLAAKGKLKVPNFDLFRKRVFLFGAGGVLLIAFLIWATVFAPSLVVTISAKTLNVNIDKSLKLQPAADSSNVDKLVFKPVVEQLKKAVATEFEATGKKNIGDKAKGTVTIRNCYFADGELTLPAGTKLTGDTNGKVYVTTQAIAVPGRTPGCPSTSSPLAGNVDVPVEASVRGPDYNVGGQTYSIDTAAGNDLDAVDTAGMSGGTSEVVTVVSQKDVDQAKEALAEQDIDAIKEELKQQFDQDVIIIEESFDSQPAKPSSSPAVGEQAQTAKLTLETTYTYIALPRDEVKQLLTNAINQSIKDEPDQQIYALGETSIVFQDFQKIKGGNYEVRLVTTGSVGPKIDTNTLAQQLVGKRLGEIQAITNQIPGVDNVDINFAPFWVSSVGSKDKIQIKFSIAPNGQ